MIDSSTSILIEKAMIEPFAYCSWHTGTDRMIIYHGAEKISTICFVCMRYAALSAKIVRLNWIYY